MNIKLQLRLGATKARATGHDTALVQAKVHLLLGSLVMSPFLLEQVLEQSFVLSAHVHCLFPALPEEWEGTNWRENGGRGDGKGWLAAGAMIRSFGYTYIVPVVYIFSGELERHVKLWLPPLVNFV